MMITMKFWQGLLLCCVIRIVPYSIIAGYFWSGDTFSEGVSFGLFVMLTLDGILRTYRDFFKIE